ncbi:MAG: hypothetical protein F4Z09_06600 [Rhodobacteraceae bacterium]|nr:hypothetical protein [Paracoccaceae bacterium]
MSGPLLLIAVPGRRFKGLVCDFFRGEACFPAKTGIHGGGFGGQGNVFGKTWPEVYIYQENDQDLGQKVRILRSVIMGPYT